MSMSAPVIHVKMQRFALIRPAAKLYPLMHIGAPAPLATQMAGANMFLRTKLPAP
jgi:hypothetical protein